MRRLSLKRAAIFVRRLLSVPHPFDPAPNFPDFCKCGLAIDDSAHQLQLEFPPRIEEDRIETNRRTNSALEWEP
jgi:hypothetical protein